jgi:hypothetical protein
MHLKAACSKYNKIVIWGLRNGANTFKYIHDGFYQTLKKRGVPVIWVDDKPSNNQVIQPDDFVISVGIAGNNMVLRDDVYYCLHNFNLDYKQYDPEKLLKLQVYVNQIERLADTKINEVTFYDTRTRTLFQPWGTNLLAEEFYPPQTDTFKLPMVFWIGSIWDNELHQGNISEIAELKKVLNQFDIRFVSAPARVPEPIMISLIQHSVISPAIAGQWQVDNNYLPCRMFKNISYGMLGISNVPKFRDVFKGCSVEGDTIGELITNALFLTKDEHREMILKQQEIVKEHTYEHKLCRIMEMLG